MSGHAKEHPDHRFFVLLVQPHKMVIVDAEGRGAGQDQRTGLSQFGDDVGGPVSACLAFDGRSAKQQAAAGLPLVVAERRPAWRSGQRPDRPDRRQPPARRNDG